MKEVLVNFGNQLKDACNLECVKLPNITEISNIIVCGMGGSAIAGDLLSCYLSNELKVPIIVNKGYGVPNFVNQNSLVFVSSYSGNTEETLSAYKLAVTYTKNVLCITSGGKLAELQPDFILRIPDGYQPRCALGWLFIPMVTALHRLGLINDKIPEIIEVAQLILELGDKFSLTDSNPFTIAKTLIDKLPIIYSDSKFSAVAMRWTTQINENSKQFAHYNVFSELNHNEIVGLGEPKIPTTIIILRDKSYNSRINLRIELTKRLFYSHTDIYEVESQGESLLARIFYLIYLGDWVSYWLAVLKGVDPTPIERIEWLKKELSK